MNDSFFVMSLDNLEAVLEILNQIGSHKRIKNNGNTIKKMIENNKNKVNE